MECEIRQIGTEWNRCYVMHWPKIDPRRARPAFLRHRRRAFRVAGGRAGVQSTASRLSIGRGGGAVTHASSRMHVPLPCGIHPGHWCALPPLFAAFVDAAIPLCAVRTRGCVRRPFER